MSIKLLFERFAVAFLLLPIAFSVVLAQTETPPAPSAAKASTIPAVKEKKLLNGLTVAVVERSNVPLVTIQLLVNSGASSESVDKAGLANLTADMLTKGTKTKTATQIAEAVEFLGGSINTGAGWNTSTVSLTVTSDKVDQAMAILADVVLNPGFDEKELDLLKSQALDGLTFSLKQPNSLAGYVASKYTFDEHPAGGTPDSIKSITTTDVRGFHRDSYTPNNAVLIFAGDITALRANALAAKTFSLWKRPKQPKVQKELIQALDMAPASPPSTVVRVNGPVKPPTETDIVNRILVIDLPKSGQAAVSYVKTVEAGRVAPDSTGSKNKASADYYRGIVLNSVLGGGYSSRLNQEIRIKRGLSYGAGSNIAWRWETANFATRIQTKNESAAEVASLVMTEMLRLTDAPIADGELVPRKSVLTGGFARNQETTGGLASAIADLYTFDIPVTELNHYAEKVNQIDESAMHGFAKTQLLNGDLIIVGDYSIFKDDLAKRFPNMKIDVIKADDLDLSKNNLRK